MFYSTRKVDVKQVAALNIISIRNHHVPFQLCLIDKRASRQISQTVKHKLFSYANRCATLCFEIQPDSDTWCCFENWITVAT